MAHFAPWQLEHAIGASRKKCALQNPNKISLIDSPFASDTASRHIRRRGSCSAPRIALYPWRSDAVIRNLLTQSGQSDFTIAVFDHDDHGMYVTSGSASGAVDPRYLDTMQKWLAGRVPRSR
jgi:hypothetical protein